MLEELAKIDYSFNQGMFITKVNNIFIMLHSAIMMDDLDRVKHYLSNDLERRFETVLNNLNEKKERQMYDELNVKTTEIKDITIKEDKVIIKVDIISRYMDYLVNKHTGQFISGNNTSRIEKTNHLTFEKQLSAHYNSPIRKCQSCGASVDINKSGKCNYCGSIFNIEKYDWILTDIQSY